MATWVKCDLGSLASVRQCAQGLLDRGVRLHALVLNAGVAATSLQMTGDGFEETLQASLPCAFLPA